MHTLITLDLEMELWDPTGCAQDSDSKHGKHSQFPLPADLNVLEDDRWEHQNYHIRENVDDSIRVVYNVLSRKG